jgi:uncharacterized membrane protein (UPF0136 family)
MRGLLSVVIGLAMIVGGLSGQLVLRGTQSGVGLAVLGAVIAAIGVIRIVRSR